jgi:AraC-like DNA-binding protein
MHPTPSALIPKPASTIGRTISILQVKQVLSGARLKGHDIKRILARAGIPLDLLNSSLARVTEFQFFGLMKILMRVTRDEMWGLGAKPIPIGTFRRACRLLAGCATLDTALREGLSFYHSHLIDFAPRLQIEGDVATIHLHQKYFHDAQSVFLEKTFLFFAYSFCCWLTMQRLPVLHVSYVDALLSPTGDAYRLYQAPVHLNQPRTAISFDRKWLKLPVMQDAAAMQEFLKKVPLNLFFGYAEKISTTDRIRQLLRGRLTEELPALGDIAVTMGVSQQTLIRRLHAEGTRYQQIKDDLRRDAAIDYLTDPRYSIKEIAFLTGFSEISTFHRAFKKWTGVAPGAYRAAKIDG